MNIFSSLKPFSETDHISFLHQRVMDEGNSMETRVDALLQLDLMYGIVPESDYTQTEVKEYCTIYS